MIYFISDPTQFDSGSVHKILRLFRVAMKIVVPNPFLSHLYKEKY